MFKKVNIVSGLFKYKCPQCRMGDMFVSPFKIKEPLSMNPSCDQCGLDFEPEPGFYFGAMFISYILTAFMMLALAGILMIGFDLTVNPTMIIIILISGLMFFKVLRMARTIWLTMTVKYSPEIYQKFQASKNNK